jgi:asparaginyl-tRNA synthetase
MERARIKYIFSEAKTGNITTVCGWVRTKRESKGIAFLALNDGSTQETLQLVVPAESAAFKQLPNCNTGAAIKAVGVIKASPGKGQNVEMEVSDIEVFGDADRSRTNTFGAVFRVRNVLADAVHAFFQTRGFVWIHTPVITASDCEGAGDLFTVTSLNLDQLPRDKKNKVDFSQDFFGRQAYLTVSGQLEAEFLAMSLGDVYTFGPTFRAENSNTSRHLSEFWMIEPEMAFADLKDDMHLAEYTLFMQNSFIKVHQ